MYALQIITKLWPSGTEVKVEGSGTVAEWTDVADKFRTDDAGENTYQFLFYNTGRRITNKRTVHWTFNPNSQQGTWTATKWYGTPSDVTGPPRVRADAISIGGDAVLSATPINAATSTFAPPEAYPFSGDNHAIGTAGGQVTVVAKDPYVDFDNYDFAGWLQLKWGGDDTGVEFESDTGSGGTIGSSGFYEHVVGGSFTVGLGTSADLLATYGYRYPRIVPGLIPDRIRDWIYEVVFPEFDKPHFDPRVDNSPIDRLRLQILGQLLSQTQPGSGGRTDFRRLVEAAPNMSPEQLKRAVRSIKTTLALGKTALGAIEAHLKAKNK